MHLPEKNLSSTDRIIRGALSIALIVFALFMGDLIGDVLLQAIIIVFAILNMISFVLGWCPVYKLANISTLKK